MNSFLGAIEKAHSYHEAVQCVMAIRWEKTKGTGVVLTV